MQTTSQILENKGYDNHEINDIISADINSFDIQTRDMFNVDEPIHLWEKYVSGDADYEKLNRQAINEGYKTWEDKARYMDNYLLMMAERYPEKI